MPVITPRPTGHNAQRWSGIIGAMVVENKGFKGIHDDTDLDHYRYLNKDFAQAPLETTREATAVLRKWRDTSRQMFLRGDWLVRPGLPERTLKKQRKESAALTLELDSTSVAEDMELLPSPSNADEAAVTPAASRLGDFE